MENSLISMRWNNHTLTFVRMLESLHVKKLFCDVTLVCEGKHYPVHKFVLAACSKYFGEVFNQSQCKHPFIFLKDISCLDIEALLNYMYKGEANISHELLPSFIKAAESLKISGLAVPDEQSSDDSNCVITPASDCSEKVSMGEFVDVEHGEIKIEPVSDTDTSFITAKSESEFNPPECLQSIVEDVEDALNSNIPVDVKKLVLENPASMILDTITCETDKNVKYIAEKNLTAFPNSKTIDALNSNIPVDVEKLVFENPASVTLETITCETDKDVKYIAENNLTGFQNSETIDTGSTEPVKKKHSCQYCHKRFRDRTARQIHVRRIHTLEKPYACSRCSYKAAVKSVLNEHYQQKHVSEKPHACPHCSVKMTAHWKLRQHIAMKHLKKQPSKKTSGEDAENQPSKKTSGEDAENLVKRETPFGESRTFKCERCSHEAVSRSKLNLHFMRIHTKEKPFRCDQCNYATTTNSQLYRHKLRHTGERPFSCTLCSSRYTLKASLLRHMSSAHD